MNEGRLNPDFWFGKKVLLTGNTGFKGSWMSVWLNYLGADVSGLALVPETSPSLFRLLDRKLDFNWSECDVRDSRAVERVVQDNAPEIVVHMAAQPLVRLSYEKPLETLNTNVMGTAHVLSAALATDSVKVVLNVTTDKCYENNEWQWGYREIDQLGGHDPYSASKACSELVTSAFRRSFGRQSGVAIATARAGNVIGGGDWSKDRLIPDLLRALSADERIIIRSPQSVRPWQHILDALHGYLVLIESLYQNGEKYDGAWNFGPRHEDVASVHSLVDKVIRSWGGTYQFGWTVDGSSKLHEAGQLRLDISKARNELKWEPLWCLNETVAAVVEWHKRWSSGEDVADICLSQIQRFCSQKH